MGSYTSSPVPQAAFSGGKEARNREIDRQLNEARAKMASQVKVLLLGSCDSGKSTILKQLRLLHKVPLSSQERESYRQLVFNNIIRGMRYILDAMDEFEMKVSEENMLNVEIIDNVKYIGDGEPFPIQYTEPLKSLWTDPSVQRAYERGNEMALPENLAYFFSDIDRLFQPNYQPTEQDIFRCEERTIGITETSFHLRDFEVLMIDVGNQKSERRKWIHCFQDVTCILFVVNLSGYDQCLVEDKDVNQMQDAMSIWESMCHSQWFKQTSIVLFLNKNDLYEEKVPVSNIKSFFPDYDGEPGDIEAGRNYFKRRFSKLAQKAGRSKGREIYIHITTATDTTMLRVMLAAVEE